MTRIVSVYDDDNETVLTSDFCEQNNICLGTSSYFFDGEFFNNALNSDVAALSRQLKQRKKIEFDGITSDRYYKEMTDAFSSGCSDVFIVFPHSSVFPYKVQAYSALRHFKRKNRYLSNPMNVFLLDTKCFSLGNDYAVKLLANKLSSGILSPEEIYAAEKEASSGKVTYCMFKGNNLLAPRNHSLKAFRFNGRRCNETCIENEPEEQKRDRFAFLCAESIKKGRDYAVSYGCECGFAKETMRLIAKYSGVLPKTVTRYGIPTEYAFGSGCVCIHLL